MDIYSHRSTLMLIYLSIDPTDFFKSVMQEWPSPISFVSFPIHKTYTYNMNLADGSEMFWPWYQGITSFR